jgi:VanZ family protein
VENVKRWLPVFVYAALIFYFSSRPGSALPRWAGLHDKILHATEYAGFAFLLSRATRRWWLAILIAAAFAVSDEYHQTFVPNRSGNDLGDLCADAGGALVGAGASLLLRARAVDGTKSA